MIGHKVDVTTNCMSSQYMKKIKKGVESPIVFPDGIRYTGRYK
jgi:hypothetical protein